MTTAHVVVFVFSPFAGGWSIPAGLLLNLPPLTVYIIAVLGGITLAHSASPWSSSGGCCRTPLRTWPRAV